MTHEEIKALAEELRAAHEAGVEQGMADRPAPALPAASEAPSPIPGAIGTVAQIAALAGALAEARKGFGPVEKNREVRIETRDGRSYKYRYAEMHVILAAVEKPLAECGLSLLCQVDGSSDGGTLRAMLLHESGGALVTTLAFSPSSDIKAFGAALSYLQRYAVSKLLCLATDSDSDDEPREGERSAESTPKPQTARESKASKPASAPKPAPAPKAEPKAAEPPKAPAADSKSTPPPPPDDEPPPPSDDDMPPEEHVEPDGSDDAPASDEIKQAVREATRAYVLAHMANIPKPQIMVKLCQDLMGCAPSDIKTEGDYQRLYAALKARL